MIDQARIDQAISELAWSEWGRHVMADIFTLLNNTSILAHPRQEAVLTLIKAGLDDTPARGILITRLSDALAMLNG